MQRTQTRFSRRAAASLAMTAVVVAGGAGLAGATTGSTFVLGRAGHETTAASLSDSRGTPLSLSAPKGKAPLAVNRSVLVKNLNAQEAGGLSAGSLKLTGGTGFAPITGDIELNGDQYVPVARTGTVPAGTYYVHASALIDLTTGDTGGFCVLADSNDDGVFYGNGGGNGENFVQAAESAVIQLAKPGTFTEACIASTSLGSEAIDAGIFAIRILSSHGRAPGGGSI
jgi:hypothetical protein